MECAQWISVGILWIALMSILGWITSVFGFDKFFMTMLAIVAFCGLGISIIQAEVCYEKRQK